MSLSTQDLKNIFDLALHNHRRGNFKKAEKLYNKILKNFPDHFQSIFLLGTLFAQVKNYKEAITLLNKAIRIAHKASLQQSQDDFEAVEDVLQAVGRTA